MEADGFFVANAPVQAVSPWELLEELGLFESALAAACRQPAVSSAQRRELREFWEQLKAHGECLVRLCEGRNF